MAGQNRRSDRRDDVAARLTITMKGPDVVRVRTDASASEDAVTPEQALALRPRLDDPTRLTNGELHPRYAEWMISYSWAEQHPLSEYLSASRHLELLTDERGYFDRKRVKQTLGPSGPKYWLVDGPLPTKVKIPLLAQLLDAPSEDLDAVVQQERTVRERHRSVVASCRRMPCTLVTYEQVIAGLPCPGCGRPWVGPQDEIDTDAEIWRALHGECRAGRNGYAGAPLHCMRCCGVPPPSAAQIAAVMRIFGEVAARQRQQGQSPANDSREADRRRAAQVSVSRARRIKKLEAELGRLRKEEEAATPIGTD